MREPLEGVNLFYLLYWLFINELSILEYLFHTMGTGECKLTRLVDGNYIFFPDSCADTSPVFEYEHGCHFLLPSFHRGETSFACFESGMLHPG